MSASNASNAYGELYTQQQAIHEFFVGNKSLIPYFLTTPTDIALLKANESSVDAMDRQVASEMMMDFFEHIWLKRHTIPKHAVAGWENYIILRFDQSIALHEYLRDKKKRDLYTEELLAHLRKHSSDYRNIAN